LRKGWQKDLEWEMQIPFKFSPPGVNKLNQNLNPFISLYPNPTNDQLTLEFSSSLYLNGNLSFRLYNIMGDEVRIIENIDRDKILMPKDGLPAGLYLYQLFKNDTIMARGKVVVQ
ncbi:MAG: T9SS type A sorting domain-containing protein, partial [Bacteroidetes bacterium]|nr:T9SS type A sorting domain-containing protein [Bacteroidota bacterium]